MKKLKWLSLLMLLLLVLGACSDSDKEKTDNTENTNETAEGKEEQEEQQEEVKKDLTHNYPYFNVKIEYISFGESYYLIQYDHAGDVANTKFEVTVKNQEKNLTGQEAYDYITPILEQLTFDATTTQISTLSNIVKTFGMPNGHSKYNVDVRLADGTELKYVQ